MANDQWPKYGPRGDRSIQGKYERIFSSQTQKTIELAKIAEERPREGKADLTQSPFSRNHYKGPNWRKYIRRPSGDRYNDVVYFVKDWKLNTELRQLLNAWCLKTGCAHVPVP